VEKGKRNAGEVLPHQLAPDDNANCLDLARTRWSVVEEIVVRPGPSGRD